MEPTDIVNNVWDNYLETIKQRFTKIENKYPHYVLSEETFRLDFGLELSKYLDSSTEVFAEFPCDKSKTQKWDLFFMKDKGVCIELKFLRAIPSGRSSPYTQHFGAVLADLLKLKYFSNTDRIKFFILICNKKFENHLLRQKMPFKYVNKNVKIELYLNGIQKTAKNEIEKRLGDSIPNENNLSLTIHKNDKIKNWSFHLIQVN